MRVGHQLSSESKTHILHAQLQPAVLVVCVYNYQLSSESRNSQLALLEASTQQTPPTHDSITAFGKQAQCMAQARISCCYIAALQHSHSFQCITSLLSQVASCHSYRWLACSVWPEAVQQAAEEVHEADRQVDVSCGHHLPAVAPHKGNAGVHQPLKQ